MIKHLLVPLDGSLLAETVLPAVEFLARQLGTMITLVHVIEESAPAMVHGQRHLREVAEAQTYLEEVARRLPEGVTVRIHVHAGSKTPIARSIVAHEGELAPDLLVMCAHGAGGLRDVLLGSVAQQVVALGQVPVLVIKPDEETVQPFRLQHILAPVEGQGEHEAGLELAVDLARALPASLELLLVLPSNDTLSARQRAATRLLPSATARMLELLSEQAEIYLDQKVSELSAQNIEVTAHTVEGEPAEVILQEAEHSNPDLVVMGTHGKTGMAAYGESSVATRVFAHLKTPLLLVPVINQP
jgi:nucleotide-binding universal stress UspA family protein